jgi:NADH:ubiquinone oxidoreductase subunit E
MAILRDLETLSGNQQLSPETLNAVAEAMNLPQSTVAGFVGFYTMFSTRPGRNS